MIDIGQAIIEQMERQGKTVGWLAKELSCDRTNIYSIYRRQSIDSNLLLRISVALQHNFFEVLSEEFNQSIGSSEH
ncbi:MAG: XRE family transcriptional regulator [Bacteroidales bacterium]|nr:XRE family transcriptional regulator [Bacteroidales bacterium]